MGFFGGERAVLNEMTSAWETARTRKGIGESRAQMYIGSGGLLRMQYGSHAAVTIADLTGNQTAAATVPTGAIFQWVTNTAPNGYLLCDGSVVSSAIYSALYGVLGTTYGESSGGGFKLPNLAGRVPIGAGQPDYYEPFKGSLHVGAKGGGLGVELTSRHLPEHSHSLDFESSDPYGQTEGPESTEVLNPTHSHDGTTGFTGQSGTSSSDDAGGSDTGGMTAWNYISMDTLHASGTVWPFTGASYQPDYYFMIAGPSGYTYNPTFGGGGSTEHTHWTDLGSHTHTLGGDPATHYHKVDGARTGFSGGSIPEKVDTTPPYLVVNFIIKI